MDEVNAVKDILRDALTRIDQTPSQPNDLGPSTSQNNEQQRRQMPPDNSSNTILNRQQQQMTPQGQGLLHRAQSNFR